jgi:hypothetical protein
MSKSTGVKKEVYSRGMEMRNTYRILSSEVSREKASWKT